MKRFIIILWGAVILAAPLAAAEKAAESPLTAAEQALKFDAKFLRTDDRGQGLLLVAGEPLTVTRILALSPWDLMELVQTLSSTELPLGRFGNNDELTKAWRLKVAAFADKGTLHPPPPSEDPFDPALVLWDPGYIQFQNEWGQWAIHLETRDITQGDLATLSPLEVQQAVRVLTGRTYAVEFVLDHLEAFRSQLSIVPPSVTPDQP